ncbi:pentapeptide repeat-containing protein [Lentzea sp. CC55]|uniref:pentapeptide repeat-containing protein n=1 Tax=Lentzea sp. CC55 TaxID=2884909 RepID=UPI0027DFD968|nr:pentapeptide repeat-containing protein [Lentzea sp. CC55]MCG8920826.1 pentapeptide repeat-containing protein [Lentzea sp. CC55]
MLAWLLAAAGLGMAMWMARSWSWWSMAWVWLGRWWMVPITVLLLVAAAALGVLRSRHPDLSPRPVAEPGTEVMPALTPRAILLGGLVLLGLGVTAAVLLLVNFSGTNPRDRLDAIRTAATLLVGTGGAAALLLAARRQRAAELSLAVQRKTAADTAHDAAARRITELYLKAVEQLGSDKAAVRHGGLYALERVAQDNPDQRQTVINVICAYLRSPFTPPPERPAARRTGLSAADRRSTATNRVAARAATARRISLAPPVSAVTSEQLRQEREVRLTAQRILTTHLCLGHDRTASQPANLRYWAEEYDLDLTDATLINFNAARLTVRQAIFANAHFFGDAQFGEATFTGPTLFDKATFTGDALFGGTNFIGDVRFNEANFTRLTFFEKAVFNGDTLFGKTAFIGRARFGEANFNSHTWFGESIFTGVAHFDNVTFRSYAQFDEAIFKENAWFDRATFIRDAIFGKATFSKNAWFFGANFTSKAWFGKVTFTGRVQFDKAIFAGRSWFDEATFTDDTYFDEATFTHIVSMKGAVATEISVGRAWPAGWTIDDHRQGSGFANEVLNMRRLVPVPVVLTQPKPSAQLQSEHPDRLPY